MRLTSRQRVQAILTNRINALHKQTQRVQPGNAAAWNGSNGEKFRKNGVFLKTRPAPPHHFHIIAGKEKRKMNMSMTPTNFVDLPSGQEGA